MRDVAEYRKRAEEWPQTGVAWGHWPEYWPPTWHSTNPALPSAMAVGEMTSESMRD